jgi:hypothetical protein
MEYLTLKEIQKKYGYKYFNLYKAPSWKKPNRDSDTVYEVRGVSNEIRENYNTISFYLSK